MLLVFRAQHKPVLLAFRAQQKTVVLVFRDQQTEKFDQNWMSLTIFLRYTWNTFDEHTERHYQEQ